MDDIKSSLDHFVAKFNESVTHSAPKKLSFEILNDSLNDSDTVPKKRRLDKDIGDVSLNGSTNTSLNSSSAVPPSPWETRRMKADLIEAKSRISQLKQELDQQTKVHEEKEALFENRFTALKEQCDYTGDKVLELQKHLKILRKREQTAIQEANNAKGEQAQKRLEDEETIHKLRQEKLQQEENARIMHNNLTNDINKYHLTNKTLEMDLKFAREELLDAKRQLEEQKSRAAAYDDMKVQLEKERQNLENANSRIKDLQYELASYGDWKEVTKVSQMRLLSVPEMTKELERLKANNKHLHELLGNKLLLEEQVNEYKTRIEREEGARAEAVSLQVKLSYIEHELKEWVKVAQDHCLPNTLVSPLALRSRLEQLLQQDIITAAEKHSTMSDTKCMENAIQDWKQKCEVYIKNIEELNVALKRHKNFKERVQKKLLLVSKERDCYKQLLETFEKELTISNATTSEMNMDAQLRYRVEMLERTLTGYKEMCAALEKELNQSRQQQAGENIIEPINDSCEHIKKELDTLRLENDKLRRRKDELELEMEHRCLKGDFNINKYKVVHLSDNPAADAYFNTQNQIEKLQAEIERLKRRNKKLEEDNEVTQARLNETANLTMTMKEINLLRSELESKDSKMKKLKECYKSASMEFREVCYKLFGYRIDRIGANTNYRLFSMYAESPDDYLNFRFTDSSVLDMLETPYSLTLQPLMASHLEGNKSLPTFLSALTLELFQRSTITIN